MTQPGDVSRRIELLDLDALNTLGAEDLLRFALDSFGARAAIGTSFQHGGLVLIDIALSITRRARIFTADPLRLHAETYAHRLAVERHFGVAVERFAPDPEAVQRMMDRHGEYLFFDSVAKRRYCCRVRKEAPNEAALKTVDCWITGLRRDQSAERAEAPRLSIIKRNGRSILKLAPLADWSRARIEEYVQRRGLPVNSLHGQGYVSIGCAVCTTPVRIGEPSRAGRWRWEGKGSSKECGLHFEEGAGI